MLGIYMSMTNLDGTSSNWINFVVFSNDREALEKSRIYLFKRGSKVKRRKLRVKRMTCSQNKGLLSKLKCMGYVRFRIEDSWRGSSDFSYLLEEGNRRTMPAVFSIL